MESKKAGVELGGAISQGPEGDVVASRRKALLAGLGKGGAVLAASIPLQTLATPASMTFDGMRCFVSGTGSKHHGTGNGVSADLGTTCNGYSQGWWGNPNGINAWPKGITGNPATLKTYKFSALMPNATQPSGDPKLVDLFTSTYASSPARHWTCAYLNACWSAEHTVNGVDSSGLNFPYSPAQVIAYANANNQAALTFFTNYMEKK